MSWPPGQGLPPQHTINYNPQAQGENSPMRPSVIHPVPAQMPGMQMVGNQEYQHYARVAEAYNQHLQQQQHQYVQMHNQAMYNAHQQQQQNLEMNQGMYTAQQLQHHQRLMHEQAYREAAERQYLQRQQQQQQEQEEAETAARVAQQMQAIDSFDIDRNIKSLLGAFK